MEYKTEGPILHTQVWCVNRELEDLGVKEGVDSWLRISVNMKNIIGVKEIPDESDSFASGKCTIYLSAKYFIINIGYDAMVNLWLPYQ